MMEMVDIWKWKWKQEWVFSRKHSCSHRIKCQRLVIKHNGSQFWDSHWSPSVVEAQMYQHENSHHPVNITKIYRMCGWTLTQALNVFIRCHILSHSNSIMYLRVTSTRQKGGDRFRDDEGLAQDLTHRMRQTILNPRADSTKSVHLSLEGLCENSSGREMKWKTGETSNEYSGHPSTIYYPHWSHLIIKLIVLYFFLQN